MDFGNRRIDFQEADHRYAELQRQHDGGTIDDEEFDAGVEQLMVLDDQSRWWAKSRSTGEWHYYDGSAWVKGAPPGYERIHATVTAHGGTEPQPPFPTLAKNWWALALGGLMLGVYGALFVYSMTVVAPSTLLLVLIGVFFAIASRGADPRLWLWQQGIITGLAGLVALLAGAAELFLASVYTVAFWGVCLGIIQVFAAYRLRRDFKVMRYIMISGASLVVYGILTMVLAAYSLLLTSIWPLASGILLVVFAFRIRYRKESEAGG